MQTVKLAIKKQGNEFTNYFLLLTQPLPFNSSHDEEVFNRKQFSDFFFLCKTIGLKKETIEHKNDDDWWTYV